MWGRWRITIVRPLVTMQMKTKNILLKPLMITDKIFMTTENLSQMLRPDTQMFMIPKMMMTLLMVKCINQFTILKIKLISQNKGYPKLLKKHQRSKIIKLMMDS
jgi:hypothetical protein